LAFFFALLLVQIMMPFFNDLSGKKCSIVDQSRILDPELQFYPDHGTDCRQLSCLISFLIQPDKSFERRISRRPLCSHSQKSIVVIQFAVSVILIIGTLVVFQQIQYAKNRPLDIAGTAYHSSLANEEINRQYDAVRND